ncbi:conserved hypothetical protein [Ricinus communis]|uniref:Uncharacterized protein n=1 Tax=Ricinus communis TaxID=3988 RepID=B9TN89_RICCO|nr:conserved hypothetical protein [Ricinus communis]
MARQLKSEWLGYHQVEHGEKGEERRHAEDHPGAEAAPEFPGQRQAARGGRGGQVAQPHLQPHHRQPARQRKHIQRQ